MRQDLDMLLNRLLPMAQMILKKHGEFFPFGAVVTTGGEVQLVGAHTGSERPPSKEVIDFLTSAFQTQARSNEIRASGICCDIYFTPVSGARTSAIQLDLESPGDCARLVVPYSKKLFRGYQLGEISRIEFVPSIFATG